MGGGLMQLVAYGAQDIYLTGNPQITFFKVVYRRHTNFSMESIKQVIEGSSTIGTSSGNQGDVTISRNGDLVTKVYVRIVTTGAANTVDAHTLLSNVECEIGGQLIDRHTSEWIQVWSELTTTAEKAPGYKFMTGGHGDWGSTTDGNNTGVSHAQVPLRFWFCKNPGLALPLIALQYHEVKLKFTWGAATTESTASVWVDYIYLDTDERRRFAQVSHEYLIEQLQIQSEGTSKNNHPLNLNHPVKELIWTEETESTDNTTKCKLILNGHDRFESQYEDYFTLRQPYDHHTAIPKQNILGDAIHPSAVNSVLRATGVASGYEDSVSTLADDTFRALRHDGSTIADGSAGARNYIQISDGKMASFKNGHHYHTRHIDVNGNSVALSSGARAADFCHVDGTIMVTENIAARCIDVDNAKSRVVFDVDVHSGEAATTSDTLSIIALDGGFALGVGTGQIEGRASKLSTKINVYSFALKPEEHQPSGTCNFSRIDNASLNFSGTLPTINNIYAVNYNVLRIMSGMGGLAYSN